MMGLLTKIVNGCRGVTRTFGGGEGGEDRKLAESTNINKKECFRESCLSSLLKYNGCNHLNVFLETGFPKLQTDSLKNT